MSTSALKHWISDPTLLPPREEPYELRAVYDLVHHGCRSELIFDWGESYLAVRVDADTDTLGVQFHPQPFVPHEDHDDLRATSPWDRLLGKECDWTWVGVNKQGYSDLLVFSFDVLRPEVILHAIGSSIEVLTTTPRPGQAGAESNGSHPT